MNINIGIPVYNNALTLAPVLEAVLDQFSDKSAVIVADDGSTDKSAALAEKAGVTTLYNETNLGLAVTRNSILSKCDGDVIVFFDADAAPRAGCIEALVSPFDDHKVAAVGGRGVEAGRDSRTGAWRAARTPQSHGKERIDKDWMAMGLCSAFRVSALKSIGGFDPAFKSAGEDVDISIRLRKAGGTIIYEPNAVVDHLAPATLPSIMAQAYRHALAASLALKKNGESTNSYVIDTLKTLTMGIIEDTKKGKFSYAGIGALNMAARSLGIAAGFIKTNP